MPVSIKTDYQPYGGKYVNRPKTSVVLRKKYYLTTRRQMDEKALKEVTARINEGYKAPDQLDTLDDVKRFWMREKEKMKAETQKRFYYHTNNSRFNLGWMAERLYVADDITLPGTSVTDLDPEFFKIVSGRPIREKKNLVKYLKDIRECFLTRLQTGFYQDEILLAEENHALEKKLLKRINEDFVKCSNGFETFLKEDHLTSREMLERAEKEAKTSHKKLVVLNDLKKAEKKIKTEVLLVHDEWRQCKMYQRFLYLLAPLEWRKVHDSNFGRIRRSETVYDPCLFDDFRDLPGACEIDVELKIQKFLEEVKNSQPPALYFTDPQQILSILEDLEKNNLRALIQCKDLDFPANNAVMGVENARNRFQKDQETLEEEIEFVKRLVNEEEEKCMKYEKNAREIVFGLFKNLITNEQYLSIISFVEDAYEDTVATADHNPDVMTMLKEIELKYESILLELDALPNFIMTRATQKFYKEQKREFAEAKSAERKVRQMNTLLTRLSKALRTQKKTVKERKIVSRSQPPEERLGKIKLPKILSKKEREQLFFFGKTAESVRLHRPLWA